MRLNIVMLGIVVLLAASLVSAERIANIAVPEEMKAKPPAGTVWDEELGLFRFDPPVPVAEPSANLLSGYGVMLYYDNGLLYYTMPQFENYFAVTRFPTPESEGGFLLTAVLVACYNDAGYEPEEGRIVIYTHSNAPECYPFTPGGDKLESEWFRYSFVGMPFSHMPDPYNPPMASWTVVDLEPPLLIDPETDPEFWVAWDYTPGFWEPGAYYTLAGYNGNMEPGDDARFCEALGSDCPGPLPYGYGAWGIRCLGEINFPERLGGRVDVKPTSCPNPIKFGDIGDVCVAVVGGIDGFDVSTVYTPEMEEDKWKAIWMTVPEPEKVPPKECLWPYKETGIKDVVTPHTNPNPQDCYDCTTEGADGFPDWPFHFKSMEMWNYLDACYETMLDRECKLVEFHWFVDEEPDGEPDYVMSSYEWLWVQIPGAERDKPGDENPPPQVGATRTGDANGFALYQNTPNPFRRRTAISFSIPVSTRTTLTLHDAVGRTVATLVDEQLPAGTHSVEWNAGLPSGVYFCRLVAGGEIAGTRMVVAR